MNARPPLSVKKKLFFAAIMTTLLVLAVEGVLRLNGFGQKLLNARDAELGWRLVPNQDRRLEHGDGRAHINAYGMRCADFPVEKPAGEYRVLVLGDSVTFGVDVDQGEIFCSRLQQSLEKRCGAGRVRIMNAGVHGYDLNQYHEYLRLRALRFQPDLVLVAFFQNDIEIADFPQPFVEFPGRDLLRKTAIFESLERLERYYLARMQGGAGGDNKDNLRRIVARYVGTEAANPTDPTYSDQVRAGRQLFARIAEFCTEHRIRLAVALLPNFYVTQHPDKNGLSSGMADWLKGLGVPTVDLLPALAPKHPDCWLAHDPGHLSALGHELVANGLETWLVYSQLVPPCP